MNNQGWYELRLAAPTVMIGTNDGERCDLRCPVCVLYQEQFDNLMHPTVVEVDAGGNVTRVNQAGTTFHQHDHEPADRGVVTTLEFSCENGHRTRLVFRFHKGTTYVDAWRGPDVTEEVTDDTIWRD